MGVELEGPVLAIKLGILEELPTGLLFKKPLTSSWMWTFRTESSLRSESEHLQVTSGATVPTGFAQTVADEAREKLGSLCKLQKWNEIYFEVLVESLALVFCLESVDSLFVEFED